MIGKPMMSGFLLLIALGIMPLARAQTPAAAPAKNCVGKAN